MQRWRWGLTLIPIVIIMGGIFTLVFWTRIPEQFPLRVIELKEDVARVDPNQVTEILAEDMAKGFFGIDVEEVQRKLNEIPWIQQASVRRVWPDKITVSIREKTPQAFFGENAVLSTEGAVFFPDDLAKVSTLLPHFQGPIQRVKEMQLQYFMLLEMLGPLGLNIAELNLSEEGSWQLKLDNGIEILLGKNALADRMARFVLVYEKLKSKNPNIAYLDLRYTNGISIGWKKDPHGNTQGNTHGSTHDYIQDLKTGAQH